MSVTEQSLEEFEQFLDRVIGESRLEIAGDKFGKAFRKECQKNKELLKKYLDQVSPQWNAWKTRKGAYLISLFLQEHPEIFSYWYDLIFPFSCDRMDIDIIKGRSNVDCSGSIIYQCTDQERAILRKICKKYEITISEREAFRMILTNTIKSFDPIISQVIENSYRLYINKIDFYEEPGFLFILVDFVGRIG
ncbi:MAG: hypothetical protein ACTSQI_20735 [Candidatus Helarchaeota archaeon]